ncbi:FAD-binding domain-containing protein [Mesobacillus subterraneus]|uniref:FAD-binding domain-containing protein n=1 Tax=Mesobacillus subterraneus TaxID=285983 RepID=UPI00273F85E4|nr:FAD-binding domain-containing protein [Mesobacillus subterraneus]WLR56859.1 FAD-binding domain-containing protein [Mesobacillus subterraneus]
MNIVLFNNDLRITDHQPLTEAARAGEVLPIYVVEPAQWKDTSFSARHFQFVAESLEELSIGIEEKGGNLFLATGEIEPVLEKLLDTYDSIKLYTHIDSRLMDKVKKWAEQNRQLLFSYGPALENISAKLLNNRLISYVKEPIVEVPNQINVPSNSPDFLFTDLKKLQNYRVDGNKIRFDQQGGEMKAIETLESFLDSRFASYIKNQQKPLPSSLSSSRLSAYITWGNISVRTIYQKTDEKMQACELEEDKIQLEAFLSKLASRVEICSRKIQHPQIDAVRKIKREWNEDWFQRWIQGRTGIPIIDASMRSLDKTGWMNFSLRAMVTAFMTNTLLLDEQKISAALAELYLDYEPAVHDFYIQQHAGMKGKMKIIDPVKVGRQLDPEGAFIRRFIPELSRLPDEYIHEPWVYPAFYQLGYEAPMVDVKKVYKKANIQNQAIEKKGKPGKKKAEGETEQLSFDI